MNIPSLGTQRESHRTNQRGRWLHEGWKSNVSQQEVKAQFREDIERADTDGPSGRLGKEQSMNFVFYRDRWSGVRVLSAIQKPVRTKTRAQVFSPGARVSRCWDEQLWCLEYVHEGFGRSSPGPSLDVICSREITNSLSLTRRTYAICFTRGAGPSQNRSRKRN